jgi:cobalt-zinc-cadmium efflux system outer membrane protein
MILRNLHRRWTILLCATLSLAAAAGSRAQSISALQSGIQQRTGHQVQWRKDTATDDLVSRAVQSLLHRALTADSAVQIALLNNRELQAAFERIGIANADLIEAGLLKNPVFEASPRFPDRPPSAADVEFSVAQDFLDLIMLPLRKKVARQELARTQLLVGDAVLKLASDTKTAFYQLQAAGQIRDGIKALDATSAAALQLSNRQHDAGNISDLDLANQQAADSQTKLDGMSADLEVQSGREKLNRLMSLWGDDLNWTIADELPPLPPDEPPSRRLEALALSQRLDLAATEAEWAGVVQALGITRTYRYIGTVELGVDTENQTDNQRITGPAFRLELPIFNQGQGRIARLQAQLREVERTLEAQAIDIRSETREAGARAEAQRSLVLYYRDELCPERKRILDLTATQYNSMLKGGYDLLLAKQNEIAAQRGYVEALRDYWIARADLERAIGGQPHNLSGPTDSEKTHH